MRAVVMAGGEGTRLRPLTCNRPKPLAPVANRPIMEHIVLLLQGHGFKDVYATLHYLADDVQRYFGDGTDFGVRMYYSVEDTPLGTAGSVKRLEENLEETFLIISGDGLTDFDLAAAVRFHKQKKALATIVLTRVPEPLEYGVVITDEQNRIVRFLEKPSWGEVFSDTVNTGMYVLEPQVLKLIDPGKPVDFSRDLFPLLLKQGDPLFGYVAEGYWTDVGNLQQYQQANFDALEGKVKISIPGEELSPGIWVGEGTEIDAEADLAGPLLIGRNCLIGRRAKIRRLTCIGDNTVVEEGATIYRSVIWNSCYLGRRAKVSAAMLGSDVVVKPNCTIAEAAVIGDKCVLEESTTVQPQVKIWPDKVTEPGSMVSMSLVWGTRWPGTLFGDMGVTGLANIEINPEFATRLGSAFGASLEAGAQVITSRDSHPVTRMIKRAFIAGLMSVGTNVLDLRMMPCSVARHATLVSPATGGMHVSLSQRDPNLVLIELFDANGRNLVRTSERKIESIFFREDYRRAHRDQVGELEPLTRTIEDYTEDLLHFVDADSIRAAQPRLVIDYSYGSMSLLMPIVLGRLRCDSVALHAYVDPTRVPAGWPPSEQELTQVADLVRALNADLGVVIDSHGERLVTVDEKGKPLIGDELLAAYLELVLSANGRGGRVAVPVSATSAIETIAEGHGAKTVRTRADARSLMEVAVTESKVIVAGDSEGGFIFPQFQPAFDGIASLCKLLDLLTQQELTLSALRQRLPAIHKHEQTVACSWDQKGAIMRQLHDETRQRKVEHLDGIKVFLEGGWVLVLPDASAPRFHVFGEADTSARAQKLVDSFSQRIQEMQKVAQKT